MIIGYSRALPLEPTGRLRAQERQLAGIGAEKFVREKAGIFRTGPELERLIDSAKKGDLIVVTRPYRLAGSTRAVTSLIDRLSRKGVGLRILNTPVDTSTTTGRMILGSTPLWSLGISPPRSLLWDMVFGWWRSPRNASGAARKRPSESAI